MHPPENVYETPERSSCSSGRHSDDLSQRCSCLCETGVRRSENVRDIYVSYDGSWMTRGHKSYYGYGSVIDLITHLVIDYEVLSVYCHGCTTVGDHMDKTSTDYATWKANHVCNKNFEGTPGGMDAAIAEILWRRSERKHGFRYVTVLSDGDAKTFNQLVSLNVYGKDCTITKEECINHVSKRLGTALRSRS